MNHQPNRGYSAQARILIMIELAVQKLPC